MYICLRDSLGFFFVLTVKVHWKQGVFKQQFEREMQWIEPVQSSSFNQARPLSELTARQFMGRGPCSWVCTSAEVSPGACVREGMASVFPLLPSFFSLPIWPHYDFRRVISRCSCHLETAGVLSSGGCT